MKKYEENFMKIERRGFGPAYRSLPIRTDCFE